MTLRSHKKRPTTAPTSTQANRPDQALRRPTGIPVGSHRSDPESAERSGHEMRGNAKRRPLLAAMIAGGFAVSLGLSLPSVTAQNFAARNYSSQNYPSQNNSSQNNSAQSYPVAGAAPIMRPVPRTGQVSNRASGNANASNPTRQGWSLKWRRSSNVAPAEDRRVAKQPSQATSQHRAGDIMPTSGTLSVATERPQFQSVQTRSVSPAAYLTTPQRADSLLDAPGGSPNAERIATRNDYSADPFGQHQSVSNQRMAQNTRPSPASTMTIVQNGEMLFPGSSGEAEIPAPAASADGTRANDLRDSLNTLDSTSDLFDMPSPQSSTEMSPRPADQPNPSLKRTDDGPSLGDLLKDSEPEELPEPKSPSNKDVEDEDFENPFGTSKDRGSNRDVDNDLRSLDRSDRDRLNLEGPDGDDDRDAGQFEDGADEDLKKTEGLSCNDFRARIQRQTIDQVSLDISPPYRPDEIDQSRYDKLKSKFDEKQAVRQWRNLSGVPMTTGRLRDIAYEKVIIETEYGSSEAIAIDQLSEGDLAYLSENWGLPQECRLQQVAYVARSWTPMTMTWKASDLCHNPLYFEDVNLERYGHTHGPVLEPIVQTAHFFGNIAVLPYKMGVHCPTECQYALGYYRPGNCAPWIKPPVPISVKGAAAQAATMTGLFWLIP